MHLIEILIPLQSRNVVLCYFSCNNKPLRTTGMLQIASRIWRASERGNTGRHRWRTFLEWQIRKIRESVADLIHKVDTFGLAPDDVHDNMWPYRYDAAPWSALRRIFRHLKLDFPRFTFIDMGCGKGRIVLAASAFSFLSVVGVEFSPPLCRIAESNLVRCRFLRRRAQSTRIIECDATEFSVPRTSCVFFFYNPFSWDLLEIVIRKIIDSYRTETRDIYLVCVGMSTVFPQIAGTPALRLLHSSSIPIGIWTKRSVYIFLVTGNRLVHSC
jgi:methyltransferase family protein